MLARLNIVMAVFGELALADDEDEGGRPAARSVFFASDASIDSIEDIIAPEDKPLVPGGMELFGEAVEYSGLELTDWILLCRRNQRLFWCAR